jgi:sulfatase maturation enzyme AslB (radical SAM superfamily)
MGKISEYDNGKGIFPTWNHENVKQMRLDIVNNHVSEVCSRCVYYTLGSDQLLWDRERYFITNLAKIENSVHRVRAAENFKRAHDSFLAGEIEVNHKPIALSINCGSACNIRCKFCYNVNMRYEVNAEKAFDFLDDCKDSLITINLSGGEPQITKFGRRLLEELGSERYQFMVSLSTNAQFIDFDLLEPVRLGWVQISTDGATKETYEKIRVGGDFKDLISNIKRFVAMRDKKPYIDVMTNYTVTSDNYHEIPQAVRLYESLGLQVQFNLVLRDPGEEQNIRERTDLHSALLTKIDEGLSLSINEWTRAKLIGMRNTIRDLAVKQNEKPKIRKRFKEYFTLFK